MRLKRDLRYMVDPEDDSKVVRFHDFQNKEHSCRILDYSRTGVSFLLEDGSLLLKIGDIISDLRFFSFDSEIHASGATIIHIQDQEEDGTVFSRIGCTYIDTAMDIYSIVKADKITKLQNEFLDFIQSMAIEENLDPEFVNLTSHLHYMLSGFQDRIVQEVQSINKEDNALQPALLDTLKELSFDALYEELVRYYDHFTKIINGFTDSKQHFIHREFFQKRLNEFFMKSKLFNRSITKPLGYAGDFEMMNIIYRNQFEGEDIFSQVMNKIDCEGTASRAVRNRRAYLYKKLRDLVTSNDNGEDRKAMSVACGPTLEFYDFLTSFNGKKLPFRFEFVAVDQDEMALADASSRIEPLTRNNDQIRVTFEQDNIKRLIVDKANNKALYKNMDLVYTAGLFDYLSSRASNRLIHKLYSFVKPGGLLIIGNFGPYNPQKFIMEFAAEWFLIYRNEEDLRELAQDLPRKAKITVEKEPEGVNLFLNIRKPE
ncbi:MAG TPA: class I SAM-dependent methyltransferase [Deltaproteobacteria bacterium]|nr:class I SAM-dependent methyltransferase [Deltaproteobacteria bacterium]HPJ93000.1 class I SAM-dependent methyltransferase [Deltaproteobacteria bacterium]HPR50457.1 class I SAM-dependent methyltransferase [Deltaproteobacteria bacterium]